MSTETKQLLTRRFQVKEIDTETRVFEGLAATYDLDLGGDIIKPGAFRQTLKDWRNGGRTLPLLDSHNHWSVRDAVGKLIDAKETDEGLWTKWRVVPGNDGDEILARLRPDDDGQSFIDSMSIGYRPIKWEFEEEADDDGRLMDRIRILKEIELHEVSLVLFPMNPGARVEPASVKDFVSTIKMFVKRYPEDVQDQVRSVLQQEFKVKPKPRAKPDFSKPVVELPDENAPDLSKFYQLRMRRLESFRSHTNT
jgi:HK97 family phage prohead protease